MTTIDHRERWGNQMYFLKYFENSPFINYSDYGNKWKECCLEIAYKENKDWFWRVK